MRTRGFSLVELVVVVAVAGVLALVAAPAFSSLLATSRVSSAAYALSADLATARLLAVTRAQAVAVCPVDAAGRCRTDGVWDQGWILFLDPERLRQPRREADILRVSQPDPGGGTRIRSSAGRSQARFLPDGRASGSNLSLRICSNHPAVAGQTLVLNNAGRLRREPLPAGHPACAPDA